LNFIDSDELTLEILANYLMLGVLVVPNDFSIEDWVKLIQLSDYLCMNGMKSISESHLCLRVNSSNLDKLSLLADHYDLKNLSLHCANF
jgi:hypothetical protein